VLKLGAYECWFDGEEIVPGSTLEERLATLESLGYQGIQLQRSTIRSLGPATVQEAFADSSIQLCVFSEPWVAQGGLLAADPEDREAALEQVKEWLHWAARLGAAGVNSAIRPNIARPEPPGSLRDREMEILVEQLSRAALVAEETGACVILEPLNRYESHFLNTLEQGVEICRAVGSPAIKIMGDFFHMNIEEADIGQSIEEAGDYLAYIHLADSNRFQPGAGHLDFRPGLAALKRIGYDGFMTLECRIAGDDKARALTESAAYIRDIYDQV
jgi:sugar phosphate isomerase/epimerase